MQWREVGGDWFEADQQDRLNQPKANTPEYPAMRARDLARRDQLRALLAADALTTAEDYYCAARIMNHGDTPDDALTAHTLALRATALGYIHGSYFSACQMDY